MLLLISALSAMHLLGANPQASAPMPKRLFAIAAAQRAAAIWVSAAVALDEHGKPSSELDGQAKAEVTRFLETPERDGCVQEGETIFDGIADSRVRSTLDTTIDTADLVFEGRVTGIAPGFFLGVPGLLYRLDVLQRLKGPPERGFYYVFLPVGRVPIGSKTICKTSAQYPSVPTMDHRVIVSTSSLGGTDHELVEIYDEEDIIIEEPGGAATLAKSLTDKQPRLSGATFSETLALIEAHLATTKRGPR